VSDALIPRGMTARGAPWAASAAYRATTAQQPDLLDWLHSGRLRLIGEDRQAVTAEQWATLAPEVRARARREFSRVVSGNTKAAVLFLR
jgi:hypothetical protein